MWTRLLFGELLKEFRQAQGISLLIVATATNTDVVKLALIEEGSDTPPDMPNFYAQLRQVPQMTLQLLSTMLDCENILSGVKEKNDEILYGERFGVLLQDFRARQELSVELVAKVLDLCLVKVRSIENGELPPPQYASFYEAMHRIPYMTSEQMQHMLSAPDVPEWPENDIPRPRLQ